MIPQSTGISEPVLAVLCLLSLFLPSRFCVWTSEKQPKQRKRLKRQHQRKVGDDFMKKIVLALSFILAGSFMLSGCLKDEILDHYNWILNNILPNDGKRKKAVVQQTHFHAPMKRRLWEIKAAASLCPAQDRRSTEGTAMLIRPVFQKHNFLKKIVLSMGVVRAKRCTIIFKLHQLPLGWYCGISERARAFASLRNRNRAFWSCIVYWSWQTVRLVALQECLAVPSSGTEQRHWTNYKEIWNPK